MSREQSPVQKKAFKLWQSSGRTLKPAEIAKKLGVDASLVRKWKSYYKWGELPDPRRGAPRGNRNASGNKGGKGAPPGNDRAVTHGLFRKILPDDEETLEIFDSTESMNPLDMLWYQIRVAWTNIMRSQKIQYVKDKDDMTKEIKKTERMDTEGFSTEKEEWEIQFAWDKQATALSSQSAAMTALTRMLKQYDEMLRTLPPEDVREDQRQRVELVKAQVERTKTQTELLKKGTNINGSVIVFKGDDVLED